MTKQVRKRPKAKGTQVQVRLQPELLAVVDAYRTDGAVLGTRGSLSRPEAIREALRDYFAMIGMIEPPKD